MELRNLGSAGLVSSAIGLGTAAFTGVYGPVSAHECQAAILLALDMGITMFDTSDLYAHGATETMLGGALSRWRREALIAVHGGMRPGPGRAAARIDGSPEYLAKACEASLQRLKTDYIDVYYLSRVDPRIPVEESVGKLAELVAEGKIRYVGLCEPTAKQLHRAQQTHPVSVLAVEYSLRRSPLSDLLEMAASLGVGVVACCPLARGLLASGGTPTASDAEHAGLRAIEAVAAEARPGHRAAGTGVAAVLTGRHRARAEHPQPGSPGDERLSGVHPVASRGVRPAI